MSLSSSRSLSRVLRANDQLTWGRGLVKGEALWARKPLLVEKVALRRQRPPWEEKRCFLPGEAAGEPREVRGAASVLGASCCAQGPSPQTHPGRCSMNPPPPSALSCAKDFAGPASQVDLDWACGWPWPTEVTMN